MELEEEWKEIEGFDRYYISNLGNVKSTIGKEKILNKYILPNGYLNVKLRKDNKSYNRLIHRLVAIAFIETDNRAKEVHHINKDKRDNRVNNLQWLTKEEHIKMHGKNAAALLQNNIDSDDKKDNCGQQTTETISQT